MAKEITMPKLSDSMEEGKVLTWFKKEGDRVTKGEPIAEVETEKADMEVEAFATGILSEIRVQAGQSAPVGDVIAVISSEEEAAAGKAKAEPEKKSAPQKTASEPQAAASGSVAKAEKSKAKERREEPAKETPASDRQQTSEKVPTRTTRQAVQREADEKVQREADDKGSSKISAESDVPTPRRNAVSPLARKLAREHGLDVEGIEGSGPGGRIVSADVRKLLEGTQPEKEEKPAAEDSSEEPKEETKQEAAPARAKESKKQEAVEDSPEEPKEETKQEAAPARAKESKKAEAAPAVAPASTGGPLEAEHRPKSAPQRLRSVIARRMTESKTTAPHFYVSVEADMTEAARLKAALGEIAPEGQAPGYNAIILKAAALALERHPGVNASWTGDAIEVHDEIHVGFAVEVEGGLLVPVIHNCSRLSLQEITVRARDLAKASRSGKMHAEDFSGGTFTVSNLGMFGIDSFIAIINLPQAAILAVGAVLDKPVVRDGVVTVAPTMAVTLSCDHRVVDGAQAARFLAELKSMLENPLALLVGA